MECNQDSRDGFLRRLLSEIEPARMIYWIRGPLKESERLYLANASALAPNYFSRYARKLPDEETREHVRGLLGHATALLILSLQQYPEEGVADWSDLLQATEILEDCARQIAKSCEPDFFESVTESAWR